MSYRIIRKEELSTTAWSGGTTTQLAIWPEGASYASRDFTWRVSTARVDAEESEFTRLPGVSRILMILDGTLELEHEGHHSVRLERFGQDAFDGGWTTRSRGRVTDFNLMMTAGEGSVGLLEIPPRGSLPVAQQQIPATWGVCSEVFYFLSSDQLVIMPDGRAVPLHTGDVVVLQYGRDCVAEEAELCNFSRMAAYVVRARIFHN